ncbi:hypothetical protein KM043_002076 [Ampulex compressa]|nr:hypothetical protein KM043_002076 [Ampulex compressa]
MMKGGGKTKGWGDGLTHLDIEARGGGEAAESRKARMERIREELNETELKAAASIPAVAFKNPNPRENQLFFAIVFALSRLGCWEEQNVEGGWKIVGGLWQSRVPVIRSVNYRFMPVNSLPKFNRIPGLASFCIFNLKRDPAETRYPGWPFRSSELLNFPQV